MPFGIESALDWVSHLFRRFQRLVFVKIQVYHVKTYLKMYYLEDSCLCLLVYHKVALQNSRWNAGEESKESESQRKSSTRKGVNHFLYAENSQSKIQVGRRYYTKMT